VARDWCRCRIDRVARRRFGVEGAVALVGAILPLVTVLSVGPQDHAVALSRHRAALPSGMSFVDQVSLRVIELEGITTAFALDSEFGAPGMRTLPAR
jgi:hypothetical protein